MHYTFMEVILTLNIHCHYLFKTVYLSNNNDKEIDWQKKWSFNDYDKNKSGIQKIF